MSGTPRHYRAFRLSLVVLVLGLFAGAVWYVVRHGEDILRLVGAGG